jgi:phosphoribosylformylglycinamidine synthase
MRPTSVQLMETAAKPKVAILREEGSNGDREMAAAMYTAGLEPWDITMSDLLQGRASLDDFRGCVFVGGFSYADVLDSAKGWAGSIRFNADVKAQVCLHPDPPSPRSSIGHMNLPELPRVQ